MRVLSAPNDIDDKAVAVNDQGQVVGMHQYNPGELRRAFFGGIAKVARKTSGALTSPRWPLTLAGKLLGV